MDGCCHQSCVQHEALWVLLLLHSKAVRWGASCHSADFPLMFSKKCSEITLNNPRRLWKHVLMMCKQQKTRVKRGLWEVWMFVEFVTLCGFSFPVNYNWGATCVIDADTSRHACYPHRGWAALKAARTLVCGEKERGWNAERKTGKEKLLRVQKASGRKDSSFTWPPWSFRCCYLEHKHWHGILRIWKFPHIRQHQPISCRPRCSFQPWAPCEGLRRPEHQKGGKGSRIRGKRSQW